MGLDRLDLMTEPTSLTHQNLTPALVTELCSGDAPARKLQLAQGCAPEHNKRRTA
jgi:hypothetical protein